MFHWESGGPPSARQWAVRKGSWKLIGNPKDTSNKAPITVRDKRFLVNLDNSVTELENLADKHPDIVQELESLHRDWVDEIRKQP